MTDPNSEQPDRLQLIERFAENFGCDLNHDIEAALVSQEADYVLDLIREARREELESWYNNYRLSTGLSQYGDLQDPFSATMRDALAALDSGEGECGEK